MAVPFGACSALLLLALAACSSEPRTDPPALSLPSSFRHAGASPGVAPPAGDDWWTVFRDPALDALQARAAAANTTIQAAAARLARSRALTRGTDAQRWPQARLRAGAGRQVGPIVNAAGGEGTLINAAVDLSYEADLFGTLQLAAAAAHLDTQSQQDLLRDAGLQVQAEVAQTYLSLRGLDAEQEVVNSAAAAWRETAAITGQRFRAGSAAELEWVRAQAEVAATESEALALLRRRSEGENALALLAGAPASGFAVPPQSLTPALPDIPAGVPAAVLARRPDVAAAWRGVQAADARVGAARNAWLPDLTLNASGGVASPHAVELLQAAMRTWSVAALLNLTLFDAGRRASQLEVAQADRTAAATAYRERVLVAIREVEDQLAALQALAAQARAQAAAVALGERTAVLAESRHRSGFASQLEVLDARRTALRTQRDALQLRSAQYQATVRLVRALGGAWEVQGMP